MITEDNNDNNQAALSLPLNFSSAKMTKYIYICEDCQEYIRIYNLPSEDCARIYILCRCSLCQNKCWWTKDLPPCPMFHKIGNGNADDDDRELEDDDDDGNDDI